jgi:hypothetical protein
MIDVIKDAILITGFVLVMMLLIEYLHVATHGLWEKGLEGGRWKQYVLTSLLGAMPGCLGGFTDVALYMHGRVSFGALVAGMLAASGDESFVMFAMIPRQALYFHILLFAIGIGAGFLTDFVFSRYGSKVPIPCELLEVHEKETSKEPLTNRFMKQWRVGSPIRVLLTIGLAILFYAVMKGLIAESEGMTVRNLLMGGTLITIAIVVTASDHFLEEHLWRHVVIRHIPRVFLWTFGTLAVLHFIVPTIHVDYIMRNGKWLVLLFAALIGIIPESGPNLIFVMLYAKGLLPLSILLANSIVQDGHSALPLLAHSKKVFLLMKFVNFAIGLALGALLLSFGY